MSVVERALDTALQPEMVVSPEARRARWAVSVIFISIGVLAASWFVRIPDIQDHLGLQPRTLGLALFGFGGGATVTLTAAGWAVARLGSRPVARVTMLGLCLTIPLLALAPSALALFGALLLMGAWAGGLEVAMNAHGVEVEARYRRPVMSSFHAMYSVGAIVGALLGGAIAALGVGPRPHLLAVASCFFVLNLVTTRLLLPATTDAGAPGPALARPDRTLLALGVICFCALLAEGAVSDWSALYLRRTLDTGPALAAMGFAAFSLAMAIGRLAGDRLSARVGPGRLVRAGGLLSAGVLTALLLIGAPAAAIGGLFVYGLGIAAMVPVVFSAAGRAPGFPAGPAIAAVATTGYLGFLSGPLLIGTVAGWTSLSAGLGVVVVLCLLAALLAGAIR